MTTSINIRGNRCNCGQSQTLCYIDRAAVGLAYTLFHLGVIIQSLTISNDGLYSLLVYAITLIFSTVSALGEVTCKACNCLIPFPDPTSREEKGLVNLSRIFGPLLMSFYTPIRLLLYDSHMISLPQECFIANARCMRRITHANMLTNQIQALLKFELPTQPH